MPDLTEVLPEAYKLVEEGLFSDDDFGDFMFADFRDFVFANPVRFWGEA